MICDALMNSDYHSNSVTFVLVISLVKKLLKIMHRACSKDANLQVKFAGQIRS